MRALGLAVILLGVLVLLIPYLREWLPALTLNRGDSLLTGCLLVAVGALTIGLSRSSS